ncbi:MAG: M28 family peptidase [Solirubrobacteraceae bacterium]|nr:M28 family peptidase [Solirubrobacteraceae bacterium]
MVDGAAEERTLREVCDTLAPIDRAPCSPGERRAAEWIADRLRDAGVDDVALEDEPSWGPFPPTVAGLGALGALGGMLAARGRRRAGLALTAASLAGIVDEAQNGPRIVRRTVRRRRSTVNVVARVGDPDAPRTLVVLAHHDAAQTGLLFDQRLMRALHERFPDRIERARNQPPQWWLGAVAPLGALLTAVTGRRGPARVGALAGAVATGLMLDMARSPTVPGANDNLSAVAVLVALAERLRADPLPGLRVWIVSAGAEETMQDGIRAFLARHRDELPVDRTWFLNNDTVGSRDLILVEGEGPFWMEDYADPAFRDLAMRCADRAGVRIERGFRARASTDAVIPSRAGYPTVLLSSLGPWRAASNYHLMTDTPDRLDLGTVADTVAVTHEVARALARQD